MSMSNDIAQQLSWAIAVRENKDFFQARSAANLVLQGSRAVKDPTVTQFLSTITKDIVLDDVLKNLCHLNSFLAEMTLWLQAHSNNKIKALDQFTADFSAGTTQSFDSFYWRHRDRRMRCLVGEYFYHLKTWISTGVDWAFVTDTDPLMPGDALVLSVPFCDTGNQPAGIDTLLDTCDRLEIPVLIDGCYYPISQGITIDLDHQCIDTATFSLSKAFPIAHLRIGIRYTRDHVFDGQKLLNTVNYNNVFSAYVGRKLMSRFESDYIYKVYRDRQIQTCQDLGLTASSSVLFAVGDNTWDRYNRKNLLDSYHLDLDPALFVNRISLVGIFDNWDIFEAIKNETTA